MIEYFYTKFGDVYPGIRWTEMKFPEYTIIIQVSKLEEYKKLKDEEKTFEQINKYGWILGNDVIEGTLDSRNFTPPKNGHYESDIFNGNYDRTVMFIFGAGASAHCVFGSDKNEFYNDLLRPPLGPALFEKRFKNYYIKYKGVKQSLHFLQDDINPDVEDLFEKEWKNIQKENNQEVLSRHINIQYYLQEVLMDVSNRILEEYCIKNLYAKLADKLQKIHSASIKTTHSRTTAKKFAFVSFNQDTILEHFISEYFKKPIKSMDDYVNVNESPFCIFKPHGSCNWGWRFPDTSKFGNDTANWLFENNINFFQLYYTLLGDHINMIDWTNTFGTEVTINKYGLGKYTIDKSKLQIIMDHPNNYFPALLLPYRDKDEFTMPFRHYNKMKSYFGYVETLIIIGWKGNEEAFNKKLLQHGHKINKIIIADPNPKEVLKNIQPLLSRNKINPTIYNNFEHFVIDGLDKEFS